MSGPSQKCVNNAISKENQTLTLKIALKMACFSLGENLDFQYFLQKVLKNQL